MGILEVVQLLLGGATWVMKYGWPWWFSEVWFAAGYTIQANSLLQAMATTLHVAAGALILAVSVVVALRAWLFFRFAEVPAMRALWAGQDRNRYRHLAQGTA
jgi:hypothetical protein